MRKITISLSEMKLSDTKDESTGRMQSLDPILNFARTLRNTQTHLQIKPPWHTKKLTLNKIWVVSFTFY